MKTTNWHQESISDNINIDTTWYMTRIIPRGFWNLFPNQSVSIQKSIFIWHIPFHFEVNFNYFESYYFISNEFILSRIFLLSLYLNSLIVLYYFMLSVSKGLSLMFLKNVPRETCRTPKITIRILIGIKNPFTQRILPNNTTFSSIKKIGVSSSNFDFLRNFYPELLLLLLTVFTSCLQFFFLKIILKIKKTLLQQSFWLP